MEYWNIAEILPLLVQAMHDIRHGSLVSQNSLISSHVLLAPFAPIWHHGWCAPIVDILTSLLRPRPHVLKWSVLPRLPQHCFKDICIQTDPLKRPIGGMWNSPKAEKKRRNMHMKLVYKQTIDRETVHNKKKTKMASARKPELFVWTDNEVQLLLWLTLDYKASKLQETRTQAAVHHCCCCCCYETCAVQRSKARGRGVGRWRHWNGKYADLPSTRKREGCVFPPWDPVSKKWVFRRCVYRIHVDDRPKQCTCSAFILKSVSVRTCGANATSWLPTHLHLVSLLGPHQSSNLPTINSKVYSTMSLLLRWSFQNLLYEELTMYTII